VLALWVPSSWAWADETAQGPAADVEERGDVEDSLRAPAAALPGSESTAGGAAAGGAGAAALFGVEARLPPAPLREPALSLFPAASASAGGFAPGLAAPGSVPSTGMLSQELAPQTTMTLALPQAAGIVGSAAMRFRLLGAEGASILDAGARVVAPIGSPASPTRLALAAFVGRAVGPRDDVDAEASAALTTLATPLFELGLSARARTELVDVFKTEEDEGRPFDLLGGPTAVIRPGAGELRAVAGYTSPRGRAPAGPTAMLFYSLDL
jgi:hypothetical protein